MQVFTYLHIINVHIDGIFCHLAEFSAVKAGQSDGEAAVGIGVFNGF